jgi:hypothetical protein
MTAAHSLQTRFPTSSVVSVSIDDSCYSRYALSLLLDAFSCPFEAVRCNGKAAGAWRLAFLWTAGARVPGATSTRLCFEPSQQQLLVEAPECMTFGTPDTLA